MAGPDLTKTILELPTDPDCKLVLLYLLNTGAGVDGFYRLDVKELDGLRLGDKRTRNAASRLFVDGFLRHESRIHTVSMDLTARRFPEGERRWSIEEHFEQVVLAYTERWRVPPLDTRSGVRFTLSEIRKKIQREVQDHRHVELHEAELDVALRDYVRWAIENLRDMNEEGIQFLPLFTTANSYWLVAHWCAGLKPEHDVPGRDLNYDEQAKELGLS